MKYLLLFLLSGTLLTTEAAVAGRRPGKRAFAHTTEAKGRTTHMRFRRPSHPLPMLDLKAHDPEKFKTVRGAKSYKFK